MKKRKITTSEVLQIFVSSTIKDLGPERSAIKEAIEELQLNPVLAEDLGARPGSPREVTLTKVRESDFYIGLFWERYGEVSRNELSATEEEYREAHAAGKPILIYIKEPAPNRKDLLTRFLKELDKGHFRTTFTTLDELKSQVKRDIMRELCKLVKPMGTDQVLLKIEPIPARHEHTGDSHQGEGVLRLLQERIIKRVTEQLDPSVKRYKTMDAVEQGCRALASKIKEDNFTPDIILAWENPNSTYHGSEIIAELLAGEIDAPIRIITMQEIGEEREVVDDCQWLKGLRKVLIVDDACYSGNTLSVIQKKLNEVDSTVELHFAVLTTLKPRILPNLYYVRTHNTEELLFPWGWSRLIVKFYDLYKYFGISDRRVVLHEATDWGSTETIDKEFKGSVRLLAIKSNKEIQQEPNREFDAFLYFLSGSAEVHIGEKSGAFLPGEYIFIPRGIGYTVNAKDTVQILELLSGKENKFNSFSSRLQCNNNKIKVQ